MEVADTNPIVITQLAKKRMAWIPKSMPVEILEHNYFARAGVWIALTIRLLHPPIVAFAITPAVTSFPKVASVLIDLHHYAAISCTLAPRLPRAIPPSFFSHGLRWR
jgi:hypothetical protein